MLLRTLSTKYNNCINPKLIFGINMMSQAKAPFTSSKNPLAYYSDFLQIKYIQNNRAMPNAIMLYKSAIQLFKLYNSNEHTYDWTLLNLNQILTSRQTHFSILKSNSTKVGINILANRLSSINGLIPLSWLNRTLNTFKLHCKRLLLCGWIIKCINKLNHLTKVPKGLITSILNSY